MQLQRAVHVLIALFSEMYRSIDRATGAVEGVVLGPPSCWVYGFESRRGEWISVCSDCCVLSGRGLCDGLITRTEESYRLWCIVVCDLETSRMRRP